MPDTTLGTELLINGNLRHSFGVAGKRWVLWHVTSGCNIECGYCYGSFKGGSYKKDFSPKNDVPLQKMLEATDAIADLGFEYVHINGGEPFLRKDIWQIIERLNSHGLKVWLLTNATFIPPYFNELFQRGWLDSLAFSIDSISPAYGNYVREDTERVIANIEKVVRLKQELAAKTLLGIYVVLTRKNLDLVEKLFDWAINLGIGYINVQTIYLPRNHLLYEDLSLRDDDKLKVGAVLTKLQEVRAIIKTSSNALMNLTAHLMQEGTAVARNCFAGRGDYIYIGPTGDVYGCPSKPKPANLVLGNIRDTSLITIMAGQEHLRECPYISLDCLGMYEMAYQMDYSEVNGDSTVGKVRALPVLSAPDLCS